MPTISFTTSLIAKTFNRRKIFSEISFSLNESNSLAIIGKNGSGKSTLLKILAGVLSPTRGEMEMEIDGKVIKHENYFTQIGLVSPYLQLYDEFSGLENLSIFSNVRGIDATNDSLEKLLLRLNIWERRYDFVRNYSSGMKQRLKYAFALLHKPPILLLDEPTSNLDAEGIDTVYEIIGEQKRNGILIIATNDDEDIRKCEQIIDLNTQSQSSRQKQ